MEMKSVFLALIASLAVPLIVHATDILAGGEYYYDVHIIWYQGDYVTFRHRGGETTLAWNDLSRDSQDAFAEDRRQSLAKQAADSKKVNTLPKEVVATKSLNLVIIEQSPVGEYVNKTLIPFGSRLHPWCEVGLFLEVSIPGDNSLVAGRHFLVPIELTDYMQRHVPEQPVLSDQERQKLGQLPLARSAY